MQRTSPKALEVARLLMCPLAAAEPWTSRTSVEALRRALAPLRERLEPLVGKEGFRALLGRAPALAKEEFPWLGAFDAGLDGLLPGLDEISAGRDPEEVQAACAAVLASLLTLLISFIGAELTRQLANGAWPDLPVQGIDFGAADSGAEEGDV